MFFIVVFMRFSNLVTSIDNVFSLLSTFARIRIWLVRFWFCEIFWEEFDEKFNEEFDEKFDERFEERFCKKFEKEFEERYEEDKNDSLERDSLIYVDENWLIKLTRSTYATYWWVFISQATTILSISAHSTYLLELYFIQHCLLLIKHSWQEVVTSLFWARMFRAVIKYAILFLRTKSTTLQREDMLNETMIW